MIKFNYEAQKQINKIKQSFNVKEENIILVDYCIGCNKKFKVYRDEIQNITAFSLYVDKLTGEKYLYYLCKKCTHEISNPYNKKIFSELDNNISKEISKLHPEILSNN
ncbi:MAG: histidine kinase [Clostridium perfringens]|nr:histidine kinase [Clostridium perfringens]MDU3020541.1 histidine kinase [Clostridium perfringens]